MILAKEELTKILENMRISIPANIKKELLDLYGNYATDDEDNFFEYTEQDIYEKKITPI